MEDRDRVPFRLDGRVAIVTGSGRGIGRAIARVFAAAGARVIVATRTVAAAEETLGLIEQDGGQARLHTCDLAKKTEAAQLVEATVAAYGRLDILVHNAGIFPVVAIDAITDEQLDETLNINLKAAFWLSAAALPHLVKAASPRLLFTSSVTGPRVALPGLVHYAASKSGLNGFIRGAAMEFAQHRITVNGVEPGLIHTDALSGLVAPDRIQKMAEAIPLKRLGTPEEIAYAMLYLASDQAAFITGQTIVVDGGALIPENAATWE